MYILAADTSFGSASVALSQDNKLVDLEILNEQNKQTEQLILMLDKLLSNNNLSAGDIDYFCATNGPGSFSGIRIAMTAMKGIVLVLDKPTISITTLHAAAVAESGNIIKKEFSVALRAGRNQCYFQEFSKIQNQILPISKPELLDVEYILKTNNSTISNDNNILENKDNSILLSSSLADAAALIAYENIKNNQVEHLESPLYIRPPDAKKQKSIWAQ